MDAVSHRNDGTANPEASPMGDKCDGGVMDEMRRKNGILEVSNTAADLTKRGNDLAQEQRGDKQKDSPLTDDDGGHGQGPDYDGERNKVAVNVTAKPKYAARAVSNKYSRARKEKLLNERFIKDVNDRNDVKIMMDTAAKIPLSKANNLRESPSTLVASSIPSNFPAELSFRALAAFSTLRTLSVPLRISPFTPIAFMRALSLPFHCDLIGIIHCNILRVLFAHSGLGRYDIRGEGFSKLKLPLSTKKQCDMAVSEYLTREESLHKEGGENLTYLNTKTWPLYFADYLSIFKLMKDAQEEEEVDSKVEVESSENDTPEMKALFKIRPSNIQSSSCEPPYVDFPWMKETKDEVQLPNGVTRAKRKKTRNSRRLKRCKRNAPDSSSDDEMNSDLEEEEEDALLESMTKGGTTFCESERNPRAVEASVHKNILLCLETLGRNTQTTSSQDSSIGDKLLPPIDDEEDWRETITVVKSVTEDEFPDIGKTVSYDSTSVKKKLSILEFLLDELLGIDFFRIEMNERMKRSIKFDKYQEIATEEVLSDPKGKKQCIICKSTGEIVRCSKCLSSYHRDCAGVPSSFDPKDKDHRWLCPECVLVDGSLVGLFKAGHKCSLDWFTLCDISVEVDSTLVGSENRDMFDRIEFLIVQGFVFLRSLDSLKSINLSALLAKTSLIEKEEYPHAPLNQFELYQLLQRIGPDVCERWPFSQIPFESQRIWPQYATRCMSSRMHHRYITSNASAFNPFVYENKYEGPPMPLIVSHMGKNDLSLLDVNEEYLKLGQPLKPTLNLQLLSTNTINDGLIASLAQSDKCSTQIEESRGVLHAIANRMFHSSLLNECWGLRNQSSDKEWWNKAVEKCNSYKGLGILLVRLIDDINTRAFRDEWFLPPGNSHEDFTLIDKEIRVYTALKESFSPAEEKRRRDWERCSASDLLRLLAKESKVKPTRSCRKRSKRSSIPKAHFEEKAQVIANVDKEEPRLNRRVRESFTRNAVKVNYVKSIKDVEGQSAEVIKESMLFRLETGVTNEDFDGEDHFTVAGRRIFEPAGSLPVPVVKGLGRNGGGKRALGVFYTDHFEIGIPSVGTVWRKKTSSCRTHAQLAYALEFVQSYFNKTVVVSCEKLSARTGLKEHIQKSVACSRFDQETAGWEHFIVHKNRMKGCWQSQNAVDASAFVVFRSTRFKAAQTRLKNRNGPLKSTLFNVDENVAPSPVISQSQIPRIPECNASMLNLMKGNVDMEVMSSFLKYEQDIHELLSKSFVRSFPSNIQDDIANLRKERLGMIQLIYASFGNVGKYLYNENDINSRLVRIEDDTSWKFKNETNRTGLIGSTKTIQHAPQQTQHDPPSTRDQQKQYDPPSGIDPMISNSLLDRSFHAPVPNFLNSALDRDYTNSYDARHTHAPTTNDRYPSDMNIHSSISSFPTRRGGHNFVEPSHSYGTPSISNVRHGNSIDHHPNYPQPSTISSQVNHFGTTRSESHYMTYPQGSSQIPNPRHQLERPHSIMENPMNHTENHHQYNSQRAGPMHQHQNQSASSQQRGYGNNGGSQYNQAPRQPQQQPHYPYLDPHQQQQGGNTQPCFDHSQPQAHHWNGMPFRPSRGGAPPPSYYENGPR